MTFSFGYSSRFGEEYAKLTRKNRRMMEEIDGKITEIISCDENTIEHYKNLRHGLSEFKRVHVGKSFVLFFKVYKKEKFILFDRIEHHDEAYKR